LKYCLICDFYFACVARTQKARTCFIFCHGSKKNDHPFNAPLTIVFVFYFFVLFFAD